jgi:NitT/TauT family transport system permease protein
MTKSPLVVLGGFWIVLFVCVWSVVSSTPGSFIPTPMSTLHAFPHLWFDRGLGVALFDSLMLNLQSAAVMMVITYVLAVATALPIKLHRVNVFRPLAILISSGRFNGFVGLPFVFSALLPNPHSVKVALLVFGMGVFTLLSLVKMIDDIPNDKFDHSRTLRMSEWQVVWEDVVLGKADEVFDIARINVAMGWMMLPMVEGRFKFEGGVGALMEVDAKQFEYPTVFCALFVILAVGLIQDAGIAYFKKVACPYAAIGMERT